MRMMMWVMALLALASEARAGCELATGPCATDSYGNTYTREQTMGGYSTYQNGQPYSQREQTLGGTYRDTYSDGYTRDYNRNTWDPPRRSGFDREGGPRWSPD
jgi:hypothetical protein